MRKIVNGILIRQGKLLLALRSPHRKAYPCRWSFPGGHVEENETLVEALARELTEEIGITPTECTFLEEMGDPNSAPANLANYYLYRITAWQGGDPRLIGDEHTELAWFTPKEAAALSALALDEYRAVFERIAKT